MKATLDMLTQLGVFHATRTTTAAKIRFLTVVQDAIDPKGKNTELYQVKGKKPSLMLMNKNVSKSKPLIVTYFDTPKFAPGNYEPGNDASLKKENILAILISFGIFVLLSLPFLFFVSNFWGNNTFEFMDVFFMIYMLLLFVYLYFLKNGFKRRNNLLRNTSSVVALIEYIKANPQADFAFVDYGCEDNYGLKSLIDMYPERKIILLDCMGSSIVKVIEKSKNLTLIAPESIQSSNKVDGEALSANIEKNLKLIKEIL